MKYPKAVSLYLVLLHLLLLLVLVKSDFIELAAVKFGKLPKELTPSYYSLLAFQKRVDEQLSADSVIFIGDSLIQGLAVSEIAPNSVNYGIGADTTLGVLTRLGFYKSLSRARIIFIMIGLNDLKRRSNAEIITNYQKILEAMPKDRAVIIGAILPVDEKVSQVGSRNKRIIDLNTLLKKLSSQFPNINFVNSNRFFLDATGNLKEKLHIGDGLHLNQAGYHVWAQQLKDTLNRY